MITIIPFKEKKENIYNIKKDLTELQKFIELYKLKSSGYHKSFFKNNHLIICNDKITEAYKIKVKDSYSNNNYLYVEFDKELINENYF